VRFYIERPESGGFWPRGGREGWGDNGEEVGGERDVGLCVPLEVHEGAEDIEVEREASGGRDKSMKSGIKNIRNRKLRIF
jgi:hypothetical protein